MKLIDFQLFNYNFSCFSNCIIFGITCKSDFEFIGFLCRQFHAYSCNTFLIGFSTVCLAVYCKLNCFGFYDLSGLIQHEMIELERDLTDKDFRSLASTLNVPEEKLRRIYPEARAQLYKKLKDRIEIHDSFH